MAITSLDSLSINVPLSSETVVAANGIYDGLQEWQAIDLAFELLKKRLPEFTFVATLPKVASINAFYGTNLYAQSRMANHIAQLANRIDFAASGQELVDLIAVIPPSDKSDKPRRYVSFASKFAHFFISKDRFPIYDNVAEQMLRRHFGRLSLPSDTKYQAFVGYINRLRESLPTRFSYVEIDRYLWITGTYFKWKDGEQINVELARFFARQNTNDSDFAAMKHLVKAQFADDV